MTRPRAYYVYEHKCIHCGVPIETRRPPGEKPTDAKQCKRCKWRLRQRRYYDRYPERVRSYRKQWATENRERVRVQNKAWRDRNRERVRAKSREYHAARAACPWADEIARSIAQLAMI